jgi:hypothetical protein
VARGDFDWLDFGEVRVRSKSRRQGVAVFAAGLMVVGLISSPSASAASPPKVKQDAFARLAATAGYSQSDIAAIQAAGKEDAFPVSVHEESPVPTVHWSSPTRVVAATSAKPGVSAASASVAKATPKYDVSTGCADYPHTISSISATTRQTLMTFRTTDHICWRRYHQGYCPCTHYAYDILSWYSPTTETAAIQHHVSGFADAAGWEWSGLDDVGNADSVTPGNVYFRRQGHFSYSFGIGPVAIRRNWYPYTGFRFIGNATGAFQYYAGGAA